MINAHPTAETADDLETMAQTLERSGGYRVLRRLAPLASREPPTGLQTRQGLFVDTETTGLDPARDEIIELAMVPFTYGVDGEIYFCQFDASLVGGDQPEDVALRDAIAIAEGVMAEYWSASRKTAWKRECLIEAGLPLEKPAKPGSLLVDLQIETKSPGGARRSTSWPRIAALKLDEARFTFSAGSDGVLLGGGCHIDVRNTAKVPLASCGVFVVAVEDGHERSEIGAYLRSGRQGAEVEGFSLGAGQMKRLHLCNRDLKDIISRPPWLIHLVGQNWPLFDGCRWFIDLELRSNYEHPTKVRVALDVDHGKAVGVSIVEQAV